jgi:transcription-repair coupling factor (superfamily II helicase)
MSIETSNTWELTSLVPLLRSSPDFLQLLETLAQHKSAAIDGAWGSSCALAAAALSTGCPGTLLVVLPRPSDVDDYAMDVQAFLDIEPAIFPSWETLPDEHSLADVVFGQRLRCLKNLESAAPPKIVVTSLPALMQPVPSRKIRDASVRTFRVGDEIDLEDITAWMVGKGFTRVNAIEEPGEFAIHGGILDVYSPDAINPVRIELFGDDIESIRIFDLASQRKLKDLDETKLSVLKPIKFIQDDGQPVSEDIAASLIESLPAGSWVALSDLAELVEEGKRYLERLGNPVGFFTPRSTLGKCATFPSVTITAIGMSSVEREFRLRTEAIEKFAGAKHKVLSELAQILTPEEQVLLACHNEGERQRLNELFQEHQPELLKQTNFVIGVVSKGFRLMEQKILVISDHELFDRREVRAGSKKAKIETRAIDSFLELNEGDYVVHISHGIARFAGMDLIEKDGVAEDHLILEFAEGMRVFVPTTLIHLVQKYVGAAAVAPKLSKLGTATWANKKQKVAKAIADMASDMIEMQAKRESMPGHPFPADSDWVKEFEAAFPYEETADQLTAIEEIRSDMQRPRAMDRLICGDVGYGKTEVAMRAAFRAIDAGKQVAVLVPTTVLAEQHYRTFSERMAEYPYNIEVISRFKTRKEQLATLEGLDAGSVDLVIGTHRLVQKDVFFKDLGLVIIDEEQRFGVEAKDMLKKLRLEVDVLTLSATPIPRTLHLSLLGVRDISNLLTPPQERQAVETRVCRWDDHLIRQAFIRELNRGGQIYFVHNRVYDIESLTDKLNAIVPEASFAIVHGQMNEDELEVNMRAFVTGECDVLVATTIIESGLDIPNANTIFIHQAENYGLADLHQLRGRVGRYKHRAYCYLLVEEGKVLTSVAAKRLKAIEEFSHLGAGFQISMRDLEIRGAGNILGTEQSGHISQVGYELYCQLLENSVRKLKKQPLREHPHVHVDLPVSAYLPGKYIPPGRPKIELYRKFSAVGNLAQIIELKAEIEDRFGPLPSEVQSMLELKEIEIYARQWKIDTLRLEDDFVVMTYKDIGAIKHLEKRNSKVKVVNEHQAYLDRKNYQTIASLIDFLKAVLR